MITIDGVSYNVPVISVERTGDFLDKYAERTEDGVLHRELIGVYFNYKISFGKTTDTVTYHALWTALTQPVVSHTVVVPDESGNYTFTAYFAGIKDAIRKQHNSKNYWEGLVVDFIAMAPAISA